MRDKIGWRGMACASAFASFIGGAAWGDTLLSVFQPPAGFLPAVAERDLEHQLLDLSGWHPFHHGNVWVVFVSVPETAYQLPPLVKQVLEEYPMPEETTIMLANVRLAERPDIKIIVVAMDHFENADPELISCKAAAFLFAYLLEQGDDWTVREYALCERAAAQD